MSSINIKRFVDVNIVHHTLSSTNTLRDTVVLIDDSTIQDFFNNRVTGGMQSYHENTGASIACTAEYNGMSFVAVVLGAVRTFAENGWQPLNYGNFNEMNELLEYASAKLSARFTPEVSLSGFIGLKAS